MNDSDYINRISVEPIETTQDNAQARFEESLQILRARFPAVLLGLAKSPLLQFGSFDSFSLIIRCLGQHTHIPIISDGLIPPSTGADLLIFDSKRNEFTVSIS